MIRIELDRKNANNPEIKAYVAAVQRAQKNTHVVPTVNGSWAVRRANAARPSKVFDNKSAAVSYAKSVAKKVGAEVIVHKKNGRIQERKLFSR